MQFCRRRRLFSLTCRNRKIFSVQEGILNRQKRMTLFLAHLSCIPKQIHLSLFRNQISQKHLEIPQAIELKKNFHRNTFLLSTHHFFHTQKLQIVPAWSRLQSIRKEFF